MLCSRGAIYRFFFILCVFLISYLFASQLNVTRVIGEARVLISKSLSSETTQPPSTTTSKTTQTTVTTTTTATTVITSTTKILNTNQSTNYTDQPKEAFVTFSNNDPTYLALLKILLDSVHAFSTRPIIAFGIDVDLNVDVKEYPRLIKRKIAQSDCGPVIECRTSFGSRCVYLRHFSQSISVNYTPLSVVTWTTVFWWKPMMLWITMLMFSSMFFTFGRTMCQSHLGIPMIPATTGSSWNNTMSRSERHRTFMLTWSGTIERCRSWRIFNRFCDKVTFKERISMRQEWTWCCGRRKPITHSANTVRIVSTRCRDRRNSFRSVFHLFGRLWTLAWGGELHSLLSYGLYYSSRLERCQRVCCAVNSTESERWQTNDANSGQWRNEISQWYIGHVLLSRQQTVADSSAVMWTQSIEVIDCLRQVISYCDTLLCIEINILKACCCSTVKCQLIEKTFGQ